MDRSASRIAADEMLGAGAAGVSKAAQSNTDPPSSTHGEAALTGLWSRPKERIE